MAEKNNKKNKLNASKRVPEKIVTLARQHGIDLYDDPDLLKIIENISDEKELPDEVYSLIAELIIHIYKVRDQWSTEQ